MLKNRRGLGWYPHNRLFWRLQKKDAWEVASLFRKEVVTDLLYWLSLFFGLMLGLSLLSFYGVPDDSAECKPGLLNLCVHICPAWQLR